MTDIAIAIHGGAGDIDPERKQSPWRERYVAALTLAAQTALEMLQRGEVALAAVTAAVRVLEDDGLFNAGHGAALCADGEAELDASVMRGVDAAAGAIAAARHIKNPVDGATALLDHHHVLLVGAAADDFARAHGLTMVERDYFKSEERVRQWQRRGHDAAPRLDHESGGTVGAVARDRYGHLAAATSTGGMSGQLPGRVGDSAIIGAGTWAENGVAAISATGTGEAFMRCAFAKSLADEIKLRGQTAAAAARIAMAQIAAIGGRGGCIVMPASGAPVMFINSLDMLRAWSDSDGHIHTAIEKTDTDS